MPTSTATHIRLPNSLRDELRRRAEEEGISMNALMLALLAGSIGFTLDSPRRSSRAENKSAGSLTAQGEPHEQQLKS
jgi:hypothetical protein